MRVSNNHSADRKWWSIKPQEKICPTHGCQEMRSTKKIQNEPRNMHEFPQCWVIARFNITNLLGIFRGSNCIESNFYSTGIFAARALQWSYHYQAFFAWIETFSGHKASRSLVIASCAAFHLTKKFNSVSVAIVTKPYQIESRKSSLQVSTVPCRVTNKCSLAAADKKSTNAIFTTRRRDHEPRPMIIKIVAW